VRWALPLIVLVACEVPPTAFPVTQTQAWPHSGTCSASGGCAAILKRDGTFELRPFAPPIDAGSPLVLELHTPWGATATASRRRTLDDSWWAFAIDFTTDTEPSVTDVAQKWTIRSTGETPFTATWTPGPDDVTLAVSLMSTASERVVQGPTPARIVMPGIAFEPSVLVPGHTVVARVEVENTGGSSARNVVVTTRSSVGTLHNQRFVFGNVRPGKRKSQAVRLAIPPTATGESATVVVIVEEADGHGQAEMTQTLKIKTDHPCPEGRFSRDRYETKREKLLKAVADGSMTQAEFDSYDAELVRCLE
jgi:hypothetical protein